jgi:hypothetical protein
MRIGNNGAMVNVAPIMKKPKRNMSDTEASSTGFKGAMKVKVAGTGVMTL